MAELISAIDEQGPFGPLEAVELPEGQQVRHSIERRALTPAEAEAERRAWRTV